MSEVIDKVPQLANPETNITSFIVTVLALAIGAFIGAVIQRFLHEEEWGKKHVFGWTTSTEGYNYEVTWGDIAGIVMAVLVIMFSGKVHKIFKYVGYGWLAYLIAFEFREMAGRL